MNKLAFFALLILIYLALFSDLSPEKTTESTLKSIDQLANIKLSAYTKAKKSIPDFAPIHYTFILHEYERRGFILKRYYHRYKVISPYFSPRFIEVKTSRKIYKKYRKYLGLSIAHIGSHNHFTPIVPGILFLENAKIGHWSYKPKSRSWRFYKAFRDLPPLLGWKEYRPTLNFYEKLKKSHFKKTSWGENKTFKRSGLIGKINYEKLEQNNKITNLKLRIKINRYFSKVFDLW